LQRSDVGRGTDRLTDMRALVASVVALILVGAFVALDTSVLHWWVYDPSEAGETNQSKWSAIYDVAETVCPERPWALVDRGQFASKSEQGRSLVTITSGIGSLNGAMFSVDSSGVVVQENDPAKRMLDSWPKRPGCSEASLEP